MKKLFALLLSISLCCSLIIPTFATVVSNEPTETNLTDAYIYFSENLTEKGISTNISLEDFLSGYESFGEKSIQSYVDSLITYEITSSSTTNATIDKNLQLATNYFNHIAFQNQPITTYSDGAKWYDNIGVSNPKLPQMASYGRHKILDTVMKGDIIHETAGGNAEIVGHIAIVEGKFWDSTYQQFYIRTLEAVLPTVTHGVLDDSRYDYRGITVYHVPFISIPAMDGAINFCISQLGKPWFIDIPLLVDCSYSSNTVNWYCSELVWAAYYNQGINLNGTTIPKHIYYPKELAASSKLVVRNVDFKIY